MSPFSISFDNILFAFLLLAIALKIVSATKRGL
jgi:hypothetical protein